VPLFGLCLGRPLLRERLTDVAFDVPRLSLGSLRCEPLARLAALHDLLDRGLRLVVRDGFFGWLDHAQACT
jgi:hypothetical protein